MTDIKVAQDEPIFPISMAAHLLDVSVHTLRMYEREGLFIPYKKESNQRLFSKSDLERIRCIRSAINDSKISISGIKMIYSMIPCWEITKCSSEDRKNCKSFNGAHDPCWVQKHPNTTCEGRECRSCEVYYAFGNCQTIKGKLKELTTNDQSK